MAFDVRLFLTRSPFRSGWFLVITTACLVCLAGIAAIVYQSWGDLRPGTVALLSLAATGILFSWVVVHDLHGKTKEIYLAQLSDRPDEVPTLNRVFEIVAISVLESFVALLPVVLMLLAIIARLLKLF